MQNGDILDIISFNEKNEKHIRRIKVQALSVGLKSFSLVGVNMHGKNPESYTLPKREWNGKPAANTSNWVAFVDSGVGEE